MNREKAPFQDVAKEHLPWLYSLARRIAGDDAEDVVQESLAKAYRKYDDLRDPVAAPAWFRQILVNCARDRFRRESSGLEETPAEDLGDYSLYRTISEEDPWPYSDTVHLDFLQSFSHDDVWAVLDRLQPKYRVPLVLVHMEGLATRQVARMLGVPLNTLLSWLRRGRKNFEKALWEYARANDLLREKEPT